MVEIPDIQWTPDLIAKADLPPAVEAFQSGLGYVE